MDKIVIKVGGSLALYPEKLKNLCIKLSNASKKYKIIVVPGGGEFADVVRVLDKRFILSESTSHRMAILAMDQYGFLLSDLITNSQVINQLDQVTETFELGKLPVFLPSNFMISSPLENSWNVTSDSIAVYIAKKLNINKVVLVTDVDGIFTEDPKKLAETTMLIGEISVKRLETMNKRTSVDAFLPKLLSKMKIKCYVVNGLFPERVEAILNGQSAIYTLII